MQTATTIIDVIEDFTGRSLTPDSLSFYEKLSINELIKLGQDIEQNFTKASYVTLPRPEEKEQVFAFSESANASQIKFLDKGMRGDPIARRSELYSALMYLPRVAVPIALEGISNTHWRTVWGEELGFDDFYRGRFIEELTFFAYIGELVRTNHIILIPNRFQKIHDERSWNTPIDSTLENLNLKDGNFSDQMILPNGTWHHSRDTAASVATREVFALLDLCSEHNYDPAFDLEIFSGVFRSIRLSRSKVPSKKLRGRKTETRVKVPRLGSVDVKTFLAARKAESFESFRADINAISRAASDQNNDADVMDLADETLTRGRERIERELKGTKLMSVAFEGMKDLSIGMASNALTGEVRQDWATDPWKALISKSVETAIKQAVKVSKTIKKRSELRSVRRLYSIMLDDQE